MPSTEQAPDERRPAKRWLEGALSRSRLKGYFAALVAVGLAALARAALDPLLHDKAPLLVFVLSVLGAALYGGLAAGLAATGLAIVAIDFFFLEPRFDLTRHEPSDFASLALFAAVGAVASILVERLHRANRAALER